MPDPIVISATIRLDPGEIQEEFFQSGGPGGQNVNKVATAVRLRFDVKGSPSLSEEVKLRLMRIAEKRVNDRGELVIEARQYRTQEKNRQAALERLVQLIRSAAHKPKLRHPTKPTLAARKRRLAEKRQRGEIKRLRGQDFDNS